MQMSQHGLSLLEQWEGFKLQVYKDSAGLPTIGVGHLLLKSELTSGKININGRDVWALRQGMAGEIGYELQGPREYAREIYDAVLEAGQEFGIRRLGGRAVFINHLEACFPTIVTDYLPAIFGEDLQEYLQEFTAAMPAFAVTFNLAGSFAADQRSSANEPPRSVAPFAGATTRSASACAIAALNRNAEAISIRVKRDIGSGMIRANYALAKRDSRSIKEAHHSVP